MNRHDFIFSNKRHYRLLRHISFWLCYMIFAGSVQLTGIFPKEITLSNILLMQSIKAANRLLPQVAFCYFIAYFLVPRFIPKKKYKQFAFAVLLSFLLLIAITYFDFLVTANSIIIHYPSTQRWTLYNVVFFSFYSNINFTGPIPACCLMLIIKYYKDWSKKHSEGEMLLRENKLAELQLLKAQVHPHFLFNTLNNIYSFTLTKSLHAAELVDKLSGMIDYMTTEGEKPLVRLEKEIQLLNDYIGLEKVRYGDRLDMQVEISENYKNKLIAPLLMIPFVENCFKHGASIMRGRQWIKLTINIIEDRLDFKLSNSKPAQAISTKNKKGIGLVNVQKRLALLYPGKHFLNIESTGDTHIVHMQVALQEQTESESAYKSAPKLEYVLHE
ncbi:MAG: histidine kinase [Bacteroidota bacterium]|nr:histidine kinase [Bacteroidota bacterium]